MEEFVLGSAIFSLLVFIFCVMLVIAPLMIWSHLKEMRKEHLKYTRGLFEAIERLEIVLDPGGERMAAHEAEEARKLALAQQERSRQEAMGAEVLAAQRKARREERERAKAEVAEARERRRAVKGFAKQVFDIPCPKCGAEDRVKGKDLEKFIFCWKCRHYFQPEEVVEWVG